MARAANEGSIYQRKDGRWVAQVTSWEGGKRKQRASYHRTQADARRQLTATTKQRDDGLPLPGAKLTVAQFLSAWLDGKADDLRPESLRRYRDSVNLHLVPELGRIPLSRLTSPEVQKCYTTLRRKQLSGTTVRLIHGTLHTALAQALKWNLVQRNVADAAFVKAPRRTTPEMRTLTPGEAVRLVAAAEGDPLEAFFVLALTSGMRLGELQALRWQSVNLDTRRLNVTATLQGIVSGKPVLGEPKTAGSKREVHLSALATDALRQHRTRQIEQRLAAGPVWEDRGFVFTTGRGRPLDGNNVRSRSFARLLARAGLPPMRFHALRHSAATLLMAQGVPVKVASEMLGHSDISTTLRIYSHVLPGMQQEAADAMDRLLTAR